MISSQNYDSQLWGNDNMSEELFEVAFSGEILDGADIDSVKQKIGQMFKADGSKLEQLFSGKRIPVKRQVDFATADKYRVAFERAGAHCEIRSLSDLELLARSEPAAVVPEESVQPEAVAQSSATDGGVYTTGDYGEVAPPPAVDPLGISSDDIEDLTASIAPVGSELQSAYVEPEAPVFDISGFDVAPVGSVLNTAEKEPEPPPPDTSGITMAD
ncbi:MAG: hypothetical protein ACI845_000687 [Gammaproteobacteria bacterium]